jgi:hypothetical protein
MELPIRASLRPLPIEDLGNRKASPSSFPNQFHTRRKVLR